MHLSFSLSLAHTFLIYYYLLRHNPIKSEKKNWSMKLLNIKMLFVVKIIARRTSVASSKIVIFACSKAVSANRIPFFFIIEYWLFFWLWKPGKPVTIIIQHTWCNRLPAFNLLLSNFILFSLSSFFIRWLCL